MKKIMTAILVPIIITVFGCSNDVPAGTPSESQSNNQDGKDQSIRTIFSAWMNSEQYKKINTVTEGSAIRTVDELQALQNHEKLEGTYYLENHIDISTIPNWTPIGNTLTPFKGTLHGNGYVVYGLTIRMQDDNRGLFGVIQDATIKDLGIGVTQIKAMSYVGALAGKVLSTEDSISNIAVTGTRADSKMESGNYSGGVVGYMEKGTLKAYNYGLEINSEDGKRVGGLVGHVENEVEIIGVNTAVLTTTSSEYVGGLVGYSNNSRVLGSNIGLVSGETSVGGLVGRSAGIVIGSNSGKVTGVDEIGGLVGESGGVGSTWSFSGVNMGVITGAVSVGGLVGRALIRNDETTGYNGEITGYNLGWIIATGVEPSVDVVVGDAAGPDETIKTYYSTSEDSDDKVGTIGGRGYNAPIKSTGVGTPEEITLPKGQNEGEWTFVTGEWPKPNLPEEVTHVLDVEIINPDPPPNFVDGKKITSIALQSSELTIRRYDTVTVTTEIEPSDAAPPVIWDFPEPLIKSDYNENEITTSIRGGTELMEDGEFTLTISYDNTLTDTLAVKINGIYDVGFEWWYDTETTKKIRAKAYDGTLYPDGAENVKPLNLCALASIGINSDYPLSGTYYLVEDIDMSVSTTQCAPGETWTPLGSADNPFTGTLYGNSFVIRNLSVTRTTVGDSKNNYHGLFAAVHGAHIENLGISSTAGIFGDGYLGILAGKAENSTLTNIAVVGLIESQGTVTDANNRSGCFCGGIVGYAKGGTFTDVYAYLVGIGAESDYVGGLIGLLETQGTNTITGTTIGYDFTTSNFIYDTDNTSMQGIVQGNNRVGGIIGGVVASSENDRVYVKAMNTFQVRGNADIGGVVGSISSSHNAGMDATNIAPVHGTFRVGGLIGNIGVNTALSVNGYNVGNIHGFYYVGGLVGLESENLTGEIKGYTMGWVTLNGLTPLAASPTIGAHANNENIIHSVYFNVGDGTDDRVGSTIFDAQSPQKGNIVGSAIDGVNDATGNKMGALVSGSDEGQWTFMSGKWPTLNFPSSITHVMTSINFKVTAPSKPLNFVD